MIKVTKYQSEVVEKHLNHLTIFYLYTDASINAFQSYCHGFSPPGMTPEVFSVIALGSSKPLVNEN